MGLLAGMPKPPKYGPPAFKQGWKDGCETGMTVYSTDYLRTLYRTNIDTNQIKNPHYKRAWDSASRYCMYYVSQHLRVGYLDTGHFSSDLRDKDLWFDHQEPALYQGVDFPWY